MNNGVKSWIKKVKEGDQKAFKKLFLRFYDPLCQFSWQFTRSRHISEELVQEVFLAVWKSKETLDPQKDIKSFLYQSVRNKALNHIKHERLAEEYNSKIDWLSPTPVTQRHNHGEESKFVQAAQEAIESLPDRARQIYMLSRKDGLTYKEISTVLDISVKTVESQMSRALKILRESLSQYI